VSVPQQGGVNGADDMGWATGIDDEARTARRRQAAWLLEAVLEERMEARLAINRWPEPFPDCPPEERADPSLDAAYQALWYFESDEERHHTEMFYLDAQLELLRQMAVFLKEGRDLPAYIRQAYSPEHHLSFYYPQSWWESLRQELKQQIAAWVSAWKRVWKPY
jgi:hypothetical protein